MISYTFDNIKRDENQGGLYDIFRQTIIDRKMTLSQDYVQETEEGRLDLVCKRLYGSVKYLEELMMINNIINMWNVKRNDTIYYVSIDLIESYRELEKDDDTSKTIANPKNKSTRTDPNRETGVIPTIKPSNFDQIIIDKKNKKIKINNKLQ